MDHSQKDLEMARAVAEQVARQGGRTFFVGGFVRDRLLNRENKDVDIEVHGVSPKCLEEILDRLAEADTTAVRIPTCVIPEKEEAV